MKCILILIYFLKTKLEQAEWMMFDLEWRPQYMGFNSLLSVAFPNSDFAMWPLPSCNLLPFTAPLPSFLSALALSAPFAKDKNVWLVYSQKRPYNFRSNMPN